MNKIHALAALAALATACGPQGDPTPLPRQAEAIAIVWRGIYSQSKDPPAVYWRRDRCNEPNGKYGVWSSCTFDDASGERVGGLEVDTDAWIEVGAPSDGIHFTNTAFAHELLHAAIGDSAHALPAWNIQRPAADAALRAVGL